MDLYIAALRRMRIGIALSLLALLGGFVMGAVFGAADGEVRAWLTRRSAEACAAAPAGAPSAEVRVERAWKYLQRAHLHANGMATSALVLVALVPFARARAVVEKLISAGLGAGAGGYACFLLLAAARTPRLGDPALVKESLKWIAMPAAGAYLAAALGAGVLLMACLLGPPAKREKAHSPMARGPFLPAVRSM